MARPAGAFAACAAGCGASPPDVGAAQPRWRWTPVRSSWSSGHRLLGFRWFIMMLPGESPGEHRTQDTRRGSAAAQCRPGLDPVLLRDAGRRIVVVRAVL